MRLLWPIGGKLARLERLVGKIEVFSMQGCGGLSQRLQVAIVAHDIVSMTQALCPGDLIGHDCFNGGRGQAAPMRDSRDLLAFIAIDDENPLR